MFRQNCCTRLFAQNTRLLDEDDSDLAEGAAVPVGGLEGGHLAGLLVLLDQDRLRGEGGEDWAVVIGVLHQN